LPNKINSTQLNRIRCT